MPLFCFSSCDKQVVEVIDCESISQLGDIETLTESKNFIPYPNTISKIIFTDISGKEFIANVVDYTTSFASVSTEPTNCPIDSTDQISYRYSQEKISFQIELDSFDIKIKLEIAPILDNEDFSLKLIADRFEFALFDPITSTSPSSKMSIIINERSYPEPSFNFSKFFAEIQIHDQYFENVYLKDSNLHSDFKLYYSENQGIIGLKNDNEECKVDLKFDRVE